MAGRSGIVDAAFDTEPASRDKSRGVTIEQERDNDRGGSEHVR